MDVQQHAVLAAPIRQARVGGEAGGQEVVHDDRRAERLGELRALVHLFRRRRGDVQIMALALAGFGFGLVHRFHDEFEAVLPAHEGLAVDVLVVLGEIEAAAQALVHRAAVVLRRQPELRLDRAAEQRAAIFVQPVALQLDAVRRAAARLHIGERKADIFQAQAAHRLEAEHVADQRGQHVDDRAFLEQVERVGDEGVECVGVARDGFDAVGAAVVVIEVGQQVGPHRRPGAGRGFGGDRGGGFLARHPGLRDDLEHRQQIGVERHVIRGPIGLAGSP